jgi:hypothetical protein
MREIQVISHTSYDVVELRLFIEIIQLDYVWMVHFTQDGHLQETHGLTLTLAAQRSAPLISTHPRLLLAGSLS